MMKLRLVLCGLALGLAPVVAGTRGSVAAQADHAADRRIIAAGEAAWGGAFVTGDVTTVDRLLAKDFSGTGSSGRIYDKRTMLATVRAGPNVTSNATRVSNIRFYGDVAIVQGHDAVVGAAPARTPHEQVWTDVWVKRSGKWQIVSSHDTRVASLQRG